MDGAHTKIRVDAVHYRINSSYFAKRKNTSCTISKLLLEREMSYVIVQLCTYQWVLKAPTGVRKIQKDGKNDTTWPF